MGHLQQLEDYIASYDISTLIDETAYPQWADPEMYAVYMYLWWIVQKC